VQQAMCIFYKVFNQLCSCGYSCVQISQGGSSPKPGVLPRFW
jgi:hypothetical protein